MNVHKSLNWWTGTECGNRTALQWDFALHVYDGWPKLTKGTSYSRMELQRAQGSLGFLHSWWLKKYKYFIYIYHFYQFQYLTKPLVRQWTNLRRKNCIGFSWKKQCFSWKDWLNSDRIDRKLSLIGSILH